MSLPVDFEKLVKLPPGNGYPNSIRAADLMKNFAWCDLLPSDTTDALQVTLVEEPGSTAQHQQRRMVITGSGGGGLHPFRISANTTNPELVDIAAGTVYHETGAITIAAQTGVTPLGLFLVKITRNTSTRVVSSATVETQAANLSHTATNAYQYLHIGSISAGVITQHYSSDIRVFEDLAVINGAFKYVPLAMSADNYYAIS